MDVQISDKNDQNANMAFELTRISKDVKLITDRLCSLYPWLLQFLDFLQNYGVKKHEDKIGYVNNQDYYEYYKALS